MKITLNFYFIFQICMVILAVITYVFFDKRYHKNHGFDIPDGFEKTEEIKVSPIEIGETLIITGDGEIAIIH